MFTSLFFITRHHSYLIIPFKTNDTIIIQSKPFQKNWMVSVRGVVVKIIMSWTINQRNVLKCKDGIIDESDEEVVTLAD